LLFLAVQEWVAGLAAYITSVHPLSRYFGYTGYLSWSIILEALRSTGELVKEYILLGLLGLCLVVFFWVSLQLVGNIFRIILGA
jgi:hypothetical protein